MPALMSVIDSVLVCLLPGHRELSRKTWNLSLMMETSNMDVSLWEQVVRSFSRQFLQSKHLLTWWWWSEVKIEVRIQSLISVV